MKNNNTTRVEVIKKGGVAVASANIFGRKVSRKITDGKSVSDFIESVKSSLDEFGCGMHDESLAQMEKDLNAIVNNTNLFDKATPSTTKSVTAVMFWSKDGVGCDILFDGVPLLGFTHVTRPHQLEDAIKAIAEELTGVMGYPEIPASVIAELKSMGGHCGLARAYASGGQEYASKVMFGSIPLYPEVDKRAEREAYINKKLLAGGIPAELAKQLIAPIMSASDKLTKLIDGRKAREGSLFTPDKDAPAPYDDSKLRAYQSGRAAEELAELVGGDDEPECVCDQCCRERAAAERKELQKEFPDCFKKPPIMHMGKEVTAAELDFGTALNALKNGEAIACDHWPKGVCLTIAGQGDEEDYIVMRTSNGKVMPWAPTHESLLSNNWVVLA